jgi:integrating conjugative element membrane protein (TIGR03745 family)
MRGRIQTRARASAQRLARILTGAALLAAARQASAALPTPVDPSTGVADGNWLELTKGYINDGAIILGLAVSAGGFLWIAWTLLAKFNDARKGDRTEWGEVGLLAIVGGAVLLFITFLLNQAAGIFTT